MYCTPVDCNALTLKQIKNKNVGFNETESNDEVRYSDDDDEHRNI